MITRPLDLSSRLRPPPRSFEFLFFLNAGLIALFFVLFGSRFVLSPGLGMDFDVPVMEGALQGAVSTDVVIAIKGADMAFVEGAKVNFKGLHRYLMERARERSGLRLLVQADSSLTTRDITEVYDMAREAGFASVQIAAESIP
jgi:biopolymer transport protein ExbD